MRTILRQPVFPLWVVSSLFSVSVFASYGTVLIFISFLHFVRWYFLELLKLSWTRTTLQFGPILLIPPHQKRKTIITILVHVFGLSKFKDDLYNLPSGAAKALHLSVRGVTTALVRF